MNQQDASLDSVAGRSPSLKPSTWWLIVIVTLCLGFGVWGWSTVAGAMGLTTGDVLYRSLSALWLSDVFQESSMWKGDWRIESSRWLGVLAFVTGATKAVFALLSVRWRRFRARLRSGHVVVIGATDLARALVDWALEMGQAVHWSEAPLDVAGSDRPKLFIDPGPFSDQSVEGLAVMRAAMCAVAGSNDTDAIAVARRIKAHGKNPPLLVSVRSPWLALHIDSLDGMQDLRLFSESQIAVRAVQRRHPPFLLASHQNNEKLHCVIVGFGDMGEAVLIETLLSSITTRYPRPVFTIIDPQAERVRHHLTLRYPELEKSADLRFVSGSIEGSDSPLSATDLAEVAKPDFISTFYVCLGNSDEALATALVLKALAQREQLTAGPIHVRLVTNSVLPQPPTGAARLSAGELIPFGATSHIITQLGLSASDSDELAKAFHKAYRNSAADSKPGNVSWEDLSEDMRDSNRRQILHIPAKLASAGVDIEHWLQSTNGDLPATWPSLDSVSDGSVEALAVLEHERWMADRRLNGWQWGDPRNDETRRHSDLVPFSDLSEASKSYDRSMVAELLQVVSRQ